VQLESVPVFRYSKISIIVMNILRFHWIRFIGAIVTLFLALFYLFGFEEFAIAGFVLIAVYTTILCARLQKGTQPAICDLCRTKSFMKVEYEHGFSHVRLVVLCPNCGRVVNKAKNGIKPGLE
jgi:hypothetical protein